MQLRAHDVLREVQRVRTGDERQPPTLMQTVVEEQLFLRVRGCFELAAPRGVLRGDHEGDLGGVDPGTADADPALHQRAEHGEEASVGVLDRALVDALGGDVGEPVEQRLARHPHAVEPDAAVVHAVEAHLAAVVLDPDTWRHLAAHPDGHDERVDALGLSAHLQLREDHRQLGVPGRVADVVLARPVAVRGDDELLAGGVVPREGAECLHIGAVPGLGHREAPHQLPGDQVRQIGLVVAFGAQMQDRATEEPELHADLHQDRQVAEGQRLESGDGGPDVAASAVLARETHTGLACRSHVDHELTHPLAKRVDTEFLGLLEDGCIRHQVGPDEVADLRILAVEHLGQRPDVDLGLHVSARVGGCVLSGHASSLPRPGTIKQPNRLPEDALRPFDRHRSSPGPRGPPSATASTTLRETALREAMCHRQAAGGPEGPGCAPGLDGVVR